ncbi:hypothetical protein HYPSUDRAFT_209620 [Hypholoma sublateritium FD-334 SS-4]|uniref:Uncharacterized protein n=1 Tax=Hypholoma sublateritium (strain FD-334 SS-4) TaxID=945553 RepID=A0A0D2N9M2_HYPSF|nr:hypothetical protein HYPSUDRAFT_209620 [Hypholoma sublateritium FD-334 SS-4]
MRPTKPVADSSFSREIPPFYNYAGASSHHAQPAPLFQNEITLHQPSKLLARQEIGLKSIPGPDRHQRTRIRFHGPSSVSRIEPRKPGRGGSDEPVYSAESDHGEEQDGEEQAGEEQDEEEQGPLSSRSSSLPPDWNFDTDSEDDGLIPKPPGEVGRPSRGGYTLKTVLGWPNKDYLRIKRFIKQAVRDHLDPSIKFSAQPEESIKVVQTLAANKFSVLSQYSACWPATDFIRAELHYTCSRARTDKRNKDAAIGKAMRKSNGKRKK